MMTSTSFISLEKNFDPSGKEQRLNLEKTIYQYPYFQLAHALYLKTLQKQNIYSFSFTLKKTAVLTPDRGTLYQWLYDVNQVKEYSEKASNQKKLKNNPTELKRNEPNNLSISSHIENLSFLEWIEWIENTSEKPPIKVNSEEKKDLIEAFIESKPKMPPISTNSSKQNLSTEISFNKDELTTETLAQVYVKQKKFKKALIAYKILSLKYPEKNSFFADQIKVIKELRQK